MGLKYKTYPEWQMEYNDTLARYGLCLVGAVLFFVGALPNMQSQLKLQRQN